MGREQLNAALRDTGLFFPIDPGADATIGGMAATRASGTNAVRYGTMREAVLSLRVVTADGRDIRTARRARKSAAGYDLTRLMIGSEGTLGVITEVTLRLHGIPETIARGVRVRHPRRGRWTRRCRRSSRACPWRGWEILDESSRCGPVNQWSKLDYPGDHHALFRVPRLATPRGLEQVRDGGGPLASGNGGGKFAWSNLSPEERSRLWKARHEAYYAALGLRPGCAWAGQRTCACR